MKKFIALALLATSTPAMAADYDNTEKFVCEMTGLSAKAVMTARQEGVAPSEVYDKLEPILKDDMPSMLKVVLILIKEAYSRPSFFSESQQTKAVADFQAEQELECINYFMKD